MFGTVIPSLIKLSLVSLILCTTVTDSQPNAAGMSQQVPADNNARAVASQVTGLVQTALGGTLQQFVPVSYRAQAIQGGVNYFIKAYVQTTTLGGQYVHMRVQNKNGQTTLAGMELNRRAEDAITYIYMRICPTDTTTG
ncbi:uncharacterized protein LOC129588458 [Paramacrobiotus metropolitanus]|uniref:uncharacterized protein LOC129588458 n=1 Tax=Paramacrobiotus metropolitanus TaxID=2943436 RepID=UPI002445C3D0|nr:uncharacterized protein LOC129588458 [Paramacrobiotus metropolitanus]